MSYAFAIFVAMFCLWIGTIVMSVDEKAKGLFALIAVAASIVVGLGAFQIYTAVVK